MTIKARVHAGRIIVDEPTNLPEGTEIELLPLDSLQIGSTMLTARLCTRHCVNRMPMCLTVG